MAVVCWTRNTNPILELDAYKGAYEEEWGHELHDVERFELRCSPSFRRWMMDLPAMARVVEVLRSMPNDFPRWVTPHEAEFIMLDNVRVISRDDVDGGEARLTAIRTEERAIPLLTISAVMP